MNVKMNRSLLHFFKTPQNQWETEKSSIYFSYLFPAVLNSFLVSILNNKIVVILPVETFLGFLFF